MNFFYKSEASLVSVADLMENKRSTFNFLLINSFDFEYFKAVEKVSNTA